MRPGRPTCRAPVVSAGESGSEGRDAVNGLHKTGIPFCTRTWPVVRGCDNALRCARNCWAKRDCWRMAHHPSPKIAEQFEGLTEKQCPPYCTEDCRPFYGADASKRIDRCRSNRLMWTGLIRTYPELLDAPLGTRKPQVIFVAPQGDLALADGATVSKIVRTIYMAIELGHEFLMLTKRPGLLVPMLPRPAFDAGRFDHLWLGVSCSRQADFDERAGAICDPSSPGYWPGRRWVSLEPQLEAIDVSRWIGSLSWTVQGCESLAGRRPGRPFHWDWAAAVRRECIEAGRPWWLKQVSQGGRVLEPVSMCGRLVRDAPEAIGAILQKCSPVAPE